MKGPTTKRDFREKSKSGEVFPFGGGGCIFELPRLDFLQFQHDFRSFSDKKGQGGQTGGGQHRGGGALAAPLYMLKKALRLNFICNVL